MYKLWPWEITPAKKNNNMNPESTPPLEQENHRLRNHQFLGLKFNMWVFHLNIDFLQVEISWNFLFEMVPFQGQFSEVYIASLLKEHAHLNQTPQKTLVFHGEARKLRRPRVFRTMRRSSPRRVDEKWDLQLTQPVANLYSLKTNMSPKNQWLENVFPIEMELFRGHASFRGCNPSKIKWDLNPTDPVEQVTIELWSILRFFRGPWTVGPVGDVLDLNSCGFHI